MKISVFLFIIFNLNVVLTDDNIAMESNVAYQDTPKIILEPLDNSSSDQIAESSHSVGQTYSHILKNQNKSNGDVYDNQNGQQAVQHSTDALSHDTVRGENQEDLQSELTQVYPQPLQPIYVQYSSQPVQIYGAEASLLYQNQIHENEGHALGYSSYVEHVSQKDEEELKSALKEGSVSDIKRLVPKSGISFKIYQNEKNSNLDLKDSETENDTTRTAGRYTQYSSLNHRIKAELPAAHLKNQHFQTVYQTQQHQLQPAAESETSQQTYQQHENFQQLLPSSGAASHSRDHQSIQQQTYHFAQPEINSQKTILEINGKSLSLKPHFKINVQDNNYKSTSATEYNPLSTGLKYGLSDISNYPKHWNLDTKSEGSQKAVEKIKPTSIHYEIDPVAFAERNKAQTQNTGGQINKHKTHNVETQKTNGNFNYQISRGNQNFAGPSTKKGYSDKKINLKARQPVSYANVDSIKQVQNQVVNPHLDSHVYKESQSKYLATTAYPDNQPAKSGQLITHVETKYSQNFDHQKALEGSTSFDIKNAIDNTGSLIHQTSEIHSFDDFNKQQLANVIPKVPVPAVVHDSGVLDAHQIKDFGISSPQVVYQTASSPDKSGKFFHQPQAVLWNPEYYKHGSAPTTNDIHQPIIKLHLPKEEFYQHLKTPNTELPISSVAHVSYQQKQPYVVYYDAPFAKHPQEIHFQSKTKARIQNQGGQLKLGQPLAVDWSLFKSTFPNFNINSLAVKPELMTHFQETGKKIVPILIRKRKNRSNNKQEIDMVLYGKINNKRKSAKPNQRQEKNIRVNLLSEASNNVRQFEPKGDRKNEFSVSASYKIDRSFKAH